MRSVAFVTLLSVLCASTARADTIATAPIPQAAIDKYYKDCMGGETPQTNPQRAQYCQCVLGELARMDDSDVAAQAQSPSSATAKMEAMAKSCIDKVLK